MTKIEEIIDNGHRDGEFVTFVDIDLEQQIQKYAERYSKKVLELAAEYLHKQFPDHSIFTHPINIQLPEHD